MRTFAWALTGLLATMPAAAATPRPPADVVKATQQFYIDALPVAGPGEDPADYPAPLPEMPDAKTVKAWLKAGVIRPIKVSPDARPDWLIDSSRMEIGNYYCGTGGCETQIWTERHGSYVKAFSQQVREYHFRWIGHSGRTWIEADFHGSACGKTGNEACPWGFEWRSDGRGYYGLRASWRFAKGEVVHPGAPPQALAPLEDPVSSGVPEPLMAMINIGETACKGWGAESLAKDGLVNSLPDLNGDGIDDWSYDGRYASCAFKPVDPEATGEAAIEPEHVNDSPCAILTCETQVWVSQREGSQITWGRAPLSPLRPYALRYKAGQVELMQLDNRPDIKTEDDPGACDTYTIDTCVLTPISLSPKP